MKMAKKLAAVLLAGVLALSVLTACSGSAGPLTKETVTDYLIDIYKVSGYQMEEDKTMEGVAQAVVSYVNSEIGKSKYNGMALMSAFREIFESADEATQERLLSSITLKKGYDYSVSYALMDESYRTDLFNQGKTAVTAAALMSGQCYIYNYYWEKAPEKWPNDSAVCVIESEINGQKCMVAVFRMPSTSSGGSASWPDEIPSESEAASGATAQ